MSILIKGMEMPKNGCKDCIFVNRKWLGDVCQILKREVTGNVERGGFETGCPLVPVPPHGALMDRDDFFATCPELVDGYLRITDDLVVIPAEEGE